MCMYISTSVHSTQDTEAEEKLKNPIDRPYNDLVVNRRQVIILINADRF